MTEVALELQRLQNSYGAALDRRDGEALREVFHPDATFAMYQPGATEPHAVIEGVDAISGIPGALEERYARTMHVMSNHLSSVSGDEATGSVYCVSHHLIDDAGGDVATPRQFVTYLIYEDRFRRGADAVWRIARREVHFQWSAEHAVLPWEQSAERGRLA